MLKTVRTVIWFRYLHFPRSHVPTLTSRTIEKSFPKKDCCHSVCFRATNRKDHSIVKVIQVVIFFIDGGGQLSNLGKWVTDHPKKVTAWNTWVKLIVETWFPGYFVPQTSRVGGSILNTRPERHTEARSRCHTGPNTARGKGWSHRVSQRLEIRKRCQVKTNLFWPFLF